MSTLIRKYLIWGSKESASQSYLKTRHFLEQERLHFTVNVSPMLSTQMPSYETKKSSVQYFRNLIILYLCTHLIQFV